MTFPISDAAFLACKDCREHFRQLNKTYGILAAAMSFLFVAVSKSLTPMEALTGYFGTFHDAGHDESGMPQDSPPNRLAAIYDEGPEGLRVTPEMWETLNGHEVQPHDFVATSDVDICAYGSVFVKTAHFCGQPAAHPIHQGMP